MGISVGNGHLIFLMSIQHLNPFLIMGNPYLRHRKYQQLTF